MTLTGGLLKNVEALRLREFRLLFTAQGVSAFGDGLLPVALSFAILEAGGNAGDIGVVFAAGLLPTVSLTLLGGVWADRFSRRRLLVASDMLRGIVQILTAGLLITGHAEVWHLVVLQALNGVGRALFFPAASAVVPHTVDAARLQQANALIVASRNISFVAGPALAGIIVATLGAGYAIALDASTFFVSLTCLLAMRAGSAATTGTGSAVASRSLVRDLAEGWGLVRQRRWLLTELVRSTFDFPIVVAPFLILGPVIALQRLGGPQAWAIIASAFFLGTLVGALIAARVQPRRPMFLCTSLMYLTAVPPLLLAFTDLGLLVAGAELVRGAAVGFFGAVWATLLQDQIPDGARSRVNAWDLTLTQGLTPVGFMVAAPLANHFGATPVLTVSGLWALMSVSVALLVPEIRNLRRDPVPAPTTMDTAR